RVPLNAEDEPRVIAELHALVDRVGRPRHVLEPASQPFDGLVVEAVDVDLQRAEDAGEPRAVLHFHLMRRDAPSVPLEPRLAVVERRARLAGNVLMEAPAERDVQHPDAAADREERDAILTRPAREVDPERVAGGG